MPLLPHAGATRGTLARYAQRQRAFLSLCVCRHGGGIKLLRLPACASHANKKKRRIRYPSFLFFSGCFVDEPRSLWMSVIPPTLTADFVFRGLDFCKIQLLRNVIPISNRGAEFYGFSRISRSFSFFFHNNHICKAISRVCVQLNTSKSFVFVFEYIQRQQCRDVCITINTSSNVCFSIR